MSGARGQGCHKKQNSCSTARKKPKCPPPPCQLECSVIVNGAGARGGSGGNGGGGPGPSQFSQDQQQPQQNVLRNQISQSFIFGGNQPQPSPQNNNNNFPESGGGGGGNGRDVEAEVDRLVDCARAYTEKEKFKLKQFYEEEMVRKKKQVIKEFQCMMEKEVVAPLKVKLCEYEREIQQLRGQLEEERRRGGQQMQQQPQQQGNECPPQQEGRRNSGKNSLVQLQDLEVVDRVLDRARKSNRQLQALIQKEKKRKSFRSMSQPSGEMGGPLLQQPLEQGQSWQESLSMSQGGEEEMREPFSRKSSRKKSVTIKGARQSRDAEGNWEGGGQGQGQGSRPTSRKGSERSRGGEEDMREMGFRGGEEQTEQMEVYEEDVSRGSLEEELRVVESLLQSGDISQETRTLVTKVKDLTESLVETTTFTEEEIRDLIRESERMEEYRRRVDDLEYENEELRRRIRELEQMLEGMRRGSSGAEERGNLVEENMELMRRLQEMEGMRSKGDLKEEMEQLKEELVEVLVMNEKEKRRSSSENAGLMPPGVAEEIMMREGELMTREETWTEEEGMWEDTLEDDMGTIREYTPEETLSRKSSGRPASRKGSVKSGKSWQSGGPSSGKGLTKEPSGKSVGSRKSSNRSRGGSGRRSSGGERGQQMETQMESVEPMTEWSSSSWGGGQTEEESERISYGNREFVQEVLNEVRRVSTESKGLSARSLGEITGPYQERIEGMVDRMKELDDQLQAMNVLESRLREMEEQGREMEGMRGRIRELEGLLEEERAKECPVCPPPDERELEEKRRRVEELERELDGVRRELEEYKRRMGELEGVNEELSRSVAGFRLVEQKHSELQSLHAQVLEEKRRRSLEAKSLMGEKGRLEGELDGAMREVDKLKDMLRGIEDRVGQREEKMKALENEVQELRRRLEQSEGEMEEMRRRLREKEGEMEDLRGQIEGLSDEARIARRRMEEAIEGRRELEGMMEGERRGWDFEREEMNRRLMEEQRRCGEACDLMSKKGQCVMEHEKRCSKVTAEMEKDNGALREKLRELEEQLEGNRKEMERKARQMQEEMEGFKQRAEVRQRELNELKKMEETCDLKGGQNSNSYLPSPVFSLPSLPTPSRMDNVEQRQPQGPSEECKLVKGQIEELRRQRDNLEGDLEGRMGEVERLNRQLEEMQGKDKQLKQEKERACRDD